MIKIKYENNSYFMSDSDVYLEMQNIVYKYLYIFKNIFIYPL